MWKFLLLYMCYNVGRCLHEICKTYRIKVGAPPGHFTEFELLWRFGFVSLWLKAVPQGQFNRMWILWQVESRSWSTSHTTPLSSLEMSVTRRGKSGHLTPHSLSCLGWNHLFLNIVPLWSDTICFPHLRPTQWDGFFIYNNLQVIHFVNQLASL